MIRYLYWVGFFFQLIIKCLEKMEKLLFKVSILNMIYIKMIEKNYLIFNVLIDNNLYFIIVVLLK